MYTLTYRNRHDVVETIKGTWTDLMRVVGEAFTVEIISWSK